MTTVISILKRKAGGFRATCRGLGSNHKNAEKAAMKVAMKAKGDQGRIPPWEYFETAGIKLTKVNASRYLAEWDLDLKQNNNTNKLTNKTV